MIDLKKKIARLDEQIDKCDDVEERKLMRKQLTGLQDKENLLLAQQQPAPPAAGTYAFTCNATSAHIVHIELGDGILTFAPHVCCDCVCVFVR